MDLSLRSIRKNIAALSVFAIIASMLVVTGVANAVATDYLDVNGGEWYEADVNWGLDNGVLDATQVNFRAGDNASRAEFFTMVARGAAIPETACDETLFPDLKADHWGCGYLTALAEAGVISGDGAGSATPGYVRPNDNILRAEAAKVVVEAYGLTGTRLGSDVFTDVEAGVWFDSYMGIANENCVFRGVNNTAVVEPAREINRAESVTVVQRGANPTTDCAPVVAAGDLTVTAASINPTDQYVPQNASNVLYAAYNLTASSNEDVDLSSLTLTLSALGSPSDFDKVRVYVDGEQVGGDKTVNSTTNQVTFTFSTTTIPAGDSVLVEVRATLATGLDAGTVDQLCLETAADVSAVGASSGAAVGVSGSFALCGGYMTVAAGSVGTLDFQVSQSDSSAVTVGTTTDLADVKFTMDLKNGELMSVMFRQTGSADPADFADLQLYLGTTMVADNPTWNGDYLTFDLSGAPVVLPDGSTKTLTLKGTIVGGLGSTVLFDIQKDFHVMAIDESGFGAKVTKLAPVSPLVARDIIGGNIAFAAAGPAAGDVAAGNEEHDFLYFNVSTLGQAIQLDKISMQADCVTAPNLNQLSNVKLWKKTTTDTWVMAAGPYEWPLGTACGAPSLKAIEEQIVVPGSSTTQFKLTGKVAEGTTAGWQYALSIKGLNLAANTEIVYPDSSGDSLDVTTDVGGTDLLGKLQTVNVPTVTVTTSATPGDKTYVPSSTNVSLAAWDFVASTASDLTITSVTVNCVATDVAPLADLETCSNAFNAASLTNTSTNFVVGAPKNVTTTTTPDGAVTFGSMNIPVLKGQSVRLLMKGNVGGSVSANDTYTFTVTGVTAKDVNNSTATSNVAGVTNRVVTIATNGALTVSIAENSNTSAKALLGDSMDTATQRVKFEADAVEAWVIDDLEVELPAGTWEEVDQAKIVFKDKTNAIVSETTYQPFASGKATFNNVGVTVAADPNEPVYAVVYTKQGNELNGALTNTPVFTQVNVVNAYGATTSVPVPGLPLSFAGNGHVYYNSVPVVAVDNGLTPPANDSAVGSPDQLMLVFDLANSASSSSDFSVTNLAITQAGTCAAVLPVSLYDSSDNLVATGTTAAALVPTSTWSFNPGDSEKVKVKVDTSGCAGGVTASVTLSSFDWNDGVVVNANSATLGVKTLPASSNGYLFP